MVPWCQENNDKFVNLYKYELNSREKYFLNLGLNCHQQNKIYHTKNKTEIELLYGQRRR